MTQNAVLISKLGDAHHASHLGEKLAAVTARRRRDGHRVDRSLPVANEIGCQALLCMHTAGQCGSRELHIGAIVDPTAAA